MKTLIVITLSAMLAASFSSTVGAQEGQKSEGMKSPMMNMMADPDSRSMMMDHIAKDPAMRQEIGKSVMTTMVLPTRE